MEKIVWLISLILWCPYSWNFPLRTQCYMHWNANVTISHWTALELIVFIFEAVLFLFSLSFDGTLRADIKCSDRIIYAMNGACKVECSSRCFQADESNRSNTFMKHRKCYQRNVHIYNGQYRKMWPSYASALAHTRCMFDIILIAGYILMWLETNAKPAHFQFRRLFGLHLQTLIFMGLFIKSINVHNKCAESWSGVSAV